MYEPRGHRDMYGAVLLPPHREDADIAVLFMHNEGYSTMCGHGIIALTTGLIEEGLYPASVPETTIRWETPAGLVTATASTETAEDGHVEVRGVRFVNVPAYLHARDLVVRPTGVGLAGPVTVQLGLRGRLLRHRGRRGPRAAGRAGVDRGAHAHRGRHHRGAARGPHARPPGRAGPRLRVRDHHRGHGPVDLSGRSGHGRHDAQRDRVRGRRGGPLALRLRDERAAGLAARCGPLAIGDEVANASITGAVFEGRVEGATRLGDRFAVITSVAGTGYVTGYHTFVVDERDPLGDGFLLR